jgi:hypothetical protein
MRVISASASPDVRIEVIFMPVGDAGRRRLLRVDLGVRYLLDDGRAS